MFNKKLWIWAAPLAAFAIQGCGGSNSIGPTQAIPTATPISGATATPIPTTTSTPIPTPTTNTTPTPVPTPTGNEPGIGSFSNILFGGNGDTSLFLATRIDSSYDSATRNDRIRVQQVKGQDNSGKDVGSFLEITENNGDAVFEKNIGQNIRIVNGSNVNGDATVAVTLTQTDSSNGDAQPRRWRAVAGLLTINSYSRNANNNTVVDFQIYQGEFVPDNSAATGTFTLNLAGKSSGQPIPN